MFALTLAGRAQTPAPWGSVRLERDSAGRPVAILENNRVRLRWAHGDETPASFALREITLKQTNTRDSSASATATAKIQGSIDFPTESVRLGYARIAADMPDRKSLLIGWNRDPAERAPSIRRIYSLFPDSPIVRIDYMNGGGSERDTPGDAVEILDFASTGSRWGRLSAPALTGPGRYEGHHLLAMREAGGGAILARVMPADVVSKIAAAPGGGLEFFASPRAMYASYLVVGATIEDIDATARELVREQPAGSVVGTALRAVRGRLGEASLPASDDAITRGELKVDPQWLRMENSQLAIAYSPDPIHNRGPKAGLAEFRSATSGVNYAVSLDAFGAGYALYSIGPIGFEISHLGDDYLEATLTRREHVDVVQSYRLFPRSPVLEIEYRRLELTWWQDFYKVPGESVVYSIYGFDREIDESAHAAIRKRAEEAAGHNFGDAFLAAAGADPKRCAYAEHFIFGAYDRASGRGLGFVMPVRIDLHSGFKLWSMETYESFPFRWLRKTAEDRAERQKLLPLRRWIFAFEGGREGLFAMGKNIAEAASAPNLETRAARFAGYVSSLQSAQNSRSGRGNETSPASGLVTSTATRSSSTVRLIHSATLPSCPGLDFFKIETPAATYYLDKLGAAIASLIDRDGHDWISFGSEPQSRGKGEFRGFPNAASFHPLNRHTPAGRSRIEHVAPDRMTIGVESGDRQWAGRYDFSPTHCTFTMTRMPADSSYWILYEGTPGGALEAGDWWMTSAIRERQSLATNHEGDIPGPEWIAFGDAKLPRVLFLLNHEDDAGPDRFYKMRDEMTVFGFGRKGGEKHIRTVPRSFSIGLLEATDHAEIGRAMARLLNGNTNP